MRYKKKILTLLLPILLLLSAGAAPAFAATYYVSTTGSDSAAGTQAAPWKTIEHAVDTMVAGDTTYVRGGTYNEGMIWFRKSGTASAPIKLINAPGESPKINFTGSGFLGILIAAGSGAGYLGPIGWIHVEGFEITNGIVGFRISNAHDLVIRRNWIHHAHSQGILGNGRNVLVDRNVINRVGDFEGCAAGKLHMPGSGGIGTVCNKDHAIYGTGPNWMVTNNLIYDNLAFGVHVAGYPVFYGTKRMALDESYAGADNWLIANNTIAYQNQRSGIIFWQGGAKNGKVINNILYENTQVAGSEQGVSFLNDGGGHVIQNNLCYATAPGATKCIEDQPGKYTASGNIVNTVNPNFVSAGPTISGVPNFHLNAGSPAIDAGLSLPQVTWDHDGGARPWPTGGQYDIGAYEYGSPPDSGSPPPNPTGGGTGGTCPPGMVPGTPGGGGTGVGSGVTAPLPTGSATVGIALPPQGGKTWYVATNGGSDSNPGTLAAPFKTIARGSQALAAGDTLLIRAGTYNEAMWSGQDGFKFTNGTASAYTRYAAYPGEEVIVKPPPGFFVARFSRSSSYIELSGLILDGTNTTSYVVKLDGSYDPNVHAMHIRLLRNELRNGRSGIGGGGDSEIIGNEIHHMRGYGMYTSFDNGLVEGNIIHDNGGFGIHHFQQNHTVNNWVIRNNVFFGNGRGYYHRATGDRLRFAPAVIISRGRNNQFYNNIVYDNYEGVSVWGNAHDNLVANNTVYGNDTNGIYIDSGESGNRILNNISFGNKRAQIQDLGTGTVLQNNLTTDPNFVNAAGGDFHLNAGSAAIDKGQTRSEFSNDFAYGLRPFGSAWDIGAYEQGAPPGQSPSPPISGGGAGGGLSCVPDPCAGGGASSVDQPPATGPITPPPAGAGNTYWVATNGSDSAAGTQAAPWKTIEHAVDTMVAGDTTYVRGGTYNEKLIVFTKSGAPGAPIRLLNAPGETPKIEFGLVGGTSSQPVYRMELNAPGATPTPIGWITIEGFEISHAYDGLKFYDAHDVVFRRNWVHHSINQGILGNGTRMLFDRNVIQHNGNFERCAAGALTSIGTSVCNQAHGMYLTGTNYVITNNLIYDSSATGIQVAGYVHCPQGGCWGGSPGAKPKVYAGPEYGGASGWLIANNVIAYNNYGPGIQLWQFSAKNNTIINNIFYENGQKSRGLTQGIVLTINTGGGHVIQNNLCYATAPGATSCISPGMQSKYTGSGNITVNPGFVNAPATLSGWPGTGVTPSGLPDFHLQASSPAIDAGQNLAPNVITDHEGGPRPWPAGGQYDIGAYEYGSPPDPNAPAPTPNWTSGTGGAGTGCVACSGEGDFLISLIPPGFTLSAGVVFSSTAFGDVYKLTRDELKDLTITPPAGFKGELSLVVSFLPADDTCMVTQDTMELSWGCEPPPPPPPPPGPYPCEPTIDNTNPPPGAAPWDATIRSKWVPVLLCMTHQYSVSMMHQMLAIGAMIDAKEQMETQRLAQQMAAEAYKDYQPSTQMCSIGTGVRSLAASEKLSENNAKGINRALMQRLTMSSSVSSAGGPDDDKRNRLDQFARKYCDLNDNNGALGPICGAASAPPARRNRDIDFTRTLENAYTLDFDMATLAGTGNTPATAATDDEEDILALANNLYSHDTFSHIGEDHVGKSYANDKVMETRSVDAMRSVALNSFAHIVGMRAQGAGESMPFLKNVLVEMGLSAAEADEMMGVKLAGTPPAAAPLKMSYFAQMEILTKKMFQTPEFFSNLYDTPENVARAGVALQAFALMNDRDRYESALRREMLISLILELKLREAQTTVNDSILRDSSGLFPKR